MNGSRPPSPTRAARTGRLALASIVALLGAITRPSAASPAPPPTHPAAPVSAPTGGYWLSVELIGPRGAQVAAAEELALGAELSEKLPTSGGLPPGELVGHVARIEDAMAWVARHAFAEVAGGAPTDPGALNEGSAPLPGGSILADQGVLLLGLIVTGATPQGGTRAIRWPASQAEALPKGLAWRPAALLPERAPLFAAPAAETPLAAERYALAERSGGLFVLDTLDRCEGHGGERRCLRWARVVARDGDRFRGGYLPSYQVALVDGWRRAAASPVPRAQLIASHTVGGKAHFLLVARTADNELHRRSLAVPLVSGGFPAAELTVAGELATVTFEGMAPMSIELRDDLDLFERPP